MKKSILLAFSLLCLTACNSSEEELDITPEQKAELDQIAQQLEEKLENEE